MRLILTILFLASFTANAQLDCPELPSGPIPSPNPNPFPDIGSGDISDDGGWTSGGGDPIEVKVQHFPNQKILDDAIELLIDKVSETRFTQRFKDAFINDLRGIQKKNHFFYIPELFAVGFNRHGGDYTKLVSNGAMTDFTREGAIYFSKQAIKYDAKTLARVIAQEIPHHIFKGRFQKNEVFANNLGTYLITQGEIPQEPYPAAQIIYEEFDEEFRDELSLKVIAETENKFNNGDDPSKVLYFLGHELYKISGSYHHYHVEFDYLDFNELNKRFPKFADITPMRKLIESSLKKCVFAPYRDGASGVTVAQSDKIAKLFIEHLDKYKEIIKSIYLVEDFYLPATKIVTDCGVGVRFHNKDKFYVFKAIFRHEGNQHGPPSTPPIGIPK